MQVLRAPAPLGRHLTSQKPDYTAITPPPIPLKRNNNQLEFPFSLLIGPLLDLLSSLVWMNGQSSQHLINNHILLLCQLQQLLWVLDWVAIPNNLEGQPGRTLCFDVSSATSSDTSCRTYTSPVRWTVTEEPIRGPCLYSPSDMVQVIKKVRPAEFMIT